MIQLHSLGPSPVWIGSDRRTVPINRLTDEHIINIGRYFRPMLQNNLVTPERRAMLHAVEAEANRRNLPYGR